MEHEEILESKNVETTVSYAKPSLSNNFSDDGTMVNDTAIFTLEFDVWAMNKVRLSSKQI